MTSVAPDVPKKIGCNMVHNVVVNELQQAYGWGSNSHFVLGEDNGVPALGPRRVFYGIEHIYEVACGFSHTALLSKEKSVEGGRVYTVGLGARGRVGGYNSAPDSEGEDLWYKRYPTEILFPAPRTQKVETLITRIVCGADFTLALSTIGELFAWGINDDGQLGVGNTNDHYTPCKVLLPDAVAQMAAGSRHALCMTRAGEMYSWGFNANGRLGVGNTQNSPHPVRVSTTWDRSPPSFVACGEAHSGCIDAKGLVYSWGAGAFGRLGIGECVDCWTPRRIEILRDVPISQLALGAFHSVALTPKGKVYAWGSGAPTGLLKKGSRAIVSTPKQVQNRESGSNLEIVTQVVCGPFHTVCLCITGGIYTFGLGSDARLGHQTFADEYHPKLILKKEDGTWVPWLEAWKGDACGATMDWKKKRKKDDETEGDGSKKPHWSVKQLCCGDMHSAVVTEGGHVYIWGSSKSGQTSFKMDLWEPTLLHMSRPVKYLAFGSNFCLAITIDLDLWAWGKGGQGQLGTGRAKDTFTPTLVALNNVKQCACGEEHSACVTLDGELYTWGSAEGGKLGHGTNCTSGQQPAPRALSQNCFRSKKDDPGLDFPRLDFVECGASHTACITSEKTVFTWGGGWYGRLGHDSMNNEYSPKQVALDVAATKIACGSYHSAMISANQDLYVWGRDCAVCEPEHLLHPKRFTHMGESGLKIKEVTCGELHTIVATCDGDVYAWGNNSRRQLGLHEYARTHVHMPEHVNTFPGFVDLLITGPNHALAALDNGQVLSWGDQSCGRLGLAEKLQSTLVPLPSKVAPVWASIEAMSGAATTGEAEFGGAEDAPPADGEVDKEAVKQMGKVLSSLREGQKVLEFHTMQALIKQEPDCGKELALQKKYEKLNTAYSGFLEEIFSLPEKEAPLLQLQRDLEQSLSANLRFLGNSVRSPDLTSLRTPTRILKKLNFYEELLWSLQQQSCYLAMLSMCIAENKAQEEIFYRVVDRIFYDLEDSRTLHLFMALLRLMIEKEVEHAKEPKYVFHPEKSRVFRLFSNFALKPIHYKKVVYPLMDITKVTPPSLVKLAELSAQRNTIFALTRDEFEQQMPVGQDPHEVTSEFTDNLEKFKGFLTLDFMKVIQFDLHENIQKIFFHALQELKGRHFTMEQKDITISTDLQQCECLMHLYIDGILLPLLGNLKKYTSKEVFLRGMGPRSSQTAANLRSVATFLQRAFAAELSNPAEDSQRFDPFNSKFLFSISKQLKPGILRYLKTMATKCEDDTETNLTVDVYTSHFSLKQHTIAVRTSDLLRLSNMLKSHINKLRLTENDAVEDLLNKIDTWDDEVVEGVQKQDVVMHNFIMNPRFLFKSRVMTMCRNSRCWVPLRLSSMTKEGAGKTEIVKNFLAPNDTVEPRRVLEDVFGKLPLLKSQNFTELKEELEMFKVQFSQGATPDYDLIEKLKSAVSTLEVLIQEEANPEDLLTFMADNLTARDRHRTYLDHVEFGKGIIEQSQKVYFEELRTAWIQMKAALNFSLDLKLPDEFSKAAHDENVVLKFMQINYQNAKVQKVDLKAMEGCSLDPTATYRCSYLKQKVIKRLGHDGEIPEQMHKFLSFTFRCSSSGGVDINVKLQQGAAASSLKQFHISEDELQEMRVASKGSEMDIGNGFMRISSADMVELVKGFASGR